MNDIKIRVATLADVAALLQIYAPYVQKTAITFDYEVPTLEEFTEKIKRLLKKNLQEYSKIYAKFLLEQEGTEIASQLGPERTLFISFFSILITNFFTNPSYFQLKNGDEAVALWMEIRENLNQMKHGLENDL